MLKILLILGLTFIASNIIASSAQAEFCRQINDHQVCIVKIKRSAKNYWEYPTQLRIDGKIRSKEVYNCRQRYRLTQSGEKISFKPDGVEDWICRTLKR